jgi:multiple sugar transport system substrate-binding protein
MVQAGAGGIPINGAVFNSPMAQEEKNRWMEPLSRALPNAVNIYQFPEAGEVVSILELGLNRAVAGELTAADAMNAMSADIHKIMSGHGYKTGLLTSK